MIVNWTSILANKGTIDFSSLEIPEDRDEFERDVAQITLRSGSIIDIGWNFETRQYIVTLFSDAFESPIAEIECSTASDVVETVRQLVDDSDRLAHSASGGSLRAEYTHA
jgi:hypothetical protein